MPFLNYKINKNGNAMKRKQFLLSSMMLGLASTALASNLKINKGNPTLKTFYLPPDPTPLIPEHGLDIRLKVRSKQTNNQFSCIDFAVAPKTMGPSPHVHEALDELMYVHEGVVSVLVGTEVVEVKAGGWHFRPKGFVHTFWNSSDKVARGTDMYFNQNFDDFLEELFFKLIPEMAQGNLPPTHPEMAKKLTDLDKRFGITTFNNQRQAIVDKFGLR